MNFLSSMAKAASAFVFGPNQDDMDEDVDMDELRRRAEQPSTSSQQGARRYVQGKRTGSSHQPVLDLQPHGAGGVQGLEWYTKQMKQDEDGDLACDFYVLEGGAHRPDPTRKDQPVVKEAKCEVLMVDEGNIVIGR